ncbi:AbiTii domain-containing protein [Pseudomonas sp. IT-232MI5]|uniref:AbiTii domain-containing protein n=1 Tax=Pseudomonas sp. IT-232MI5 TaxID=3026442 RepID=UPI0039DFC9F1
MSQNGTLKEALPLSEAILSEIELSQAPLTSIALKASRLARLVGDFDQQQIMMYEASGYPKTPKGIESSVWQLAALAGRTYKQIKDEKEKEYCKCDSLEQIELEMVTAKENILAAADVSTSISSANPNQYVSNPIGNARERTVLREIVSDRSKWLAARRAYIHSYVSSVYFELKFSSIPSDIFERTRSKVDKKIGELVPGAIKKFSAVYENLVSENDEDWANAVHSCRRILQETADGVYPPRADKEVGVGGKQKTVKLGPDNYINRLIAYVEENSDSDRFNEIVGSHMRYLGERLDSIFQAAQKGSHHVISSQDEADRYVIYTYLVIGDILQLKNEVEKGVIIDQV